MDETNEPQKGVKPTSPDIPNNGEISPQEEGTGNPASPNTSKPHGTFGPARIKDEIRSRTSNPETPGNTGDHEKEKLLELRGDILGHMKALLRRAKDVQEKASERVPGEVERIIDDLQIMKKDLEDGRSKPSEQIQLYITKKESELSDIEKAIFDMADTSIEKIGEALTKQEQALRLSQMLIAQVNYTKIKYQLKDELARIKNADTKALPSKEKILTAFDELTWIEDFSELEKFANDEAFDIQGLHKKIEDLSNAIDEAETTLIAQNETIERIKSEGHKQSLELSKNIQEANSLKVIDTSLITAREKLAKKARDAEAAFQKAPSDISLSAFDKVIEEYSELIQKLKSSVVVTVEAKPITPPAFLSRTITPSQDDSESTSKEQKPTDPQITQVEANTEPSTPDEPLEKTPKDDTHIEGLIGTWDTKYRVKVGNRELTIGNRRIPGTILRYEDIVKKTKNKNADFAQATSHKESVIKALREGDFTKATGSAMALGKELDTIVKEHLTVPEILLGTLDRYRRVSKNLKNSEVDFKVATSLRDEVSSAIDEGDFTLADQKAQALGGELTALEEKSKETKTADKETKVEGEKVPPKAEASTKAADPKAVEAETKKSEDLNPESILFRGSVRKIPGGPLQIKIGEEFKDIPKAVPTALYKYKEIYTNPENKDKDFGAATAIKDIILKKVETGNFDDALKGAQNLMAELSKLAPGNENIQGKFRNAPVGDIISLFDRSKRFTPEKIKARAKSGKNEVGELLEDLAKWEEKWLRSGALDVYRQKNGTIPISDEQIASTKKILEVYFEILRRGPTGTVNPEIVTKAGQESITLVMILAGRHDEVKSDIKIYIENYSKDADEKLFQKLQGYLQVTPKDIESLSTPTIIKGNAMRPTVSGPEMSPVMQNKIFESHKKLLSEAHETLEKITPHLTSELEKQAFTRLYDELLKLKDQASATPTKQLIALFVKKVNYFNDQLSKKVAFVIAVNGADVLSDEATLTQSASPEAKIMRSKRLRGDEEAKETVEQWTARQAAKGTERDLEESRKKKEADELYDKHREIFMKNPSLYKEIYHEKNNVRDSLTEDISGRVARDVVIDLKNKRHEVMSRQLELQAEAMSGTFVGNYEQAMASITREITALDAEIKKYTDINLSKTTAMPMNNSFVDSKQIYSPVLDATLDDPTRQIGKTHTLNEDNKLVEIDRESLTKEQIEELYANEVNPKDPTGMRQLQEKVLLSESPYPSQTAGMISTPELTEVTEAHAKESAQILEESRQEIPSTPESQRERQTFMNKLADTLFRYPSIRQRPWGWLAAGLSMVALSAGTTYVAAKSAEANKEGKTLADIIKNQPSWRVSVTAPKWFVQNVSEPSEKNFNALITTSAPSFDVSAANPAAKEKISNLLCKDVYDVEGAGAGLTKAQQEECSSIINNLQSIMKTIKAPPGVLYDKNTRFFADLTLREFYEQVGKVAATADKEEERLRTI